MKFAVLMTCHNRVATTLECLQHLFAARLEGNWCFDVWLNDDGSSDGTGERVKKEFPSVNVVQGSGHDYWCGGMRRIWNAAACDHDYDGYLWLNDDTMLTEGVFEILFSTEAKRIRDSILVGAVCGKDGKATYGGEKQEGFYPPDGTWTSIIQMNGNVVWIPRSVYNTMGNLPDYMTHTLGDSYYSRMAVKCGIPVLLTPVFIGRCERNPSIPAWKREDVPLLARLKSLYSPLGGSEPSVVFRYRASIFGLGVAVRVVFTNHLRALFPRFWKERKVETWRV